MNDPKDAYNEDNIFAKILRGEIPSAKIFDNADCLAIMDAFPQSRGHCLLIPKSPSRNLFDADPADLAQVIPHIQTLARATMAAMGADGIRVAQFNEVAAGQTVFHLHWHIIPIYEGTELSAHAEGMADPAQLEKLAGLITAELD